MSLEAIRKAITELPDQERLELCKWLDLEVLNLREREARQAMEDEPISEAEEQAVARSKEWFRHNEGIPFEDVLAEFGYTVEQIRHPERDLVREPAA